MGIVSHKEVECLREQYPAGTRVELVSMDDPYRKIPEGAKGTVTCVDDIGTIHVDWDAGYRLGLITGADEFRIAEEDGNG